MLQGVKFLPALLLWGFFNNELEHDVCLFDSFSIIFLKLLYILQASSCPQQGLSSYSSGISQRSKLIALKKTNSVLTSLVLKSHLKRRGSALLVNITLDPSPGVRVKSDTHLAELKEVLGSGCVGFFLAVPCCLQQRGLLKHHLSVKRILFPLGLL